MPAAEFEEKEYEAAAVIELATLGLSPGPVRSSGQVLEKLLGYDAAADPDPTHPIWRVLAVPRPPGIRLLPRLWQPGGLPPAPRLPSHPVSLMLQFKRPEYLQGATAKQWHRWRRPYFRFTRNAQQQRVLLRLERSAGPQAAVRYAAPAFWRAAELESAHLARTVIKQTGFVSPMTLGSHKVWTYTQPGVKGFGNPDGTRRRFETVDDYIIASLETAQGALEPLQDEEPYATHIRMLGEAAIDREPALRAELRRWRRNLESAMPSLSAATVESLVQYAGVQSIVHRIGATWLISGRD